MTLPYCRHRDRVWITGAQLAIGVFMAVCGAATDTGETLPFQECATCHQSIVEQYRDHGMARSLGPLGSPDQGVVVNPHSGVEYQITTDSSGSWLAGRHPDGGVRTQKLVGRIGAGLFDVSWVGMEVDPWRSTSTGRLFFAPVETVTGHGLELSPFENRKNSAGLDMSLTDGCLTCHTDDRLEGLSGAAVDPDSGRVFPENLLGETAFDELRPLGCDACHGDPAQHLQMMPNVASDGSIGLEKLGDMSASRQLRRCGRCHLQGDARIDLVGGRIDPDRPIAAQVAVVVPGRGAADEEDFRFVSQLERLALSACYLQSPDGLTCTTCHDPHRGVAAQGLASFDARCQSCHEVCDRPAEARIEATTGRPATSEQGCVECHMRRSQPFDLPHVQSRDHLIRRRIALPRTDLPHRQFANQQGELELFDDPELTAVAASATGRRWRDGVMAMALMTMGRTSEAAPLFASFPPPGSAEATAEPRSSRVLQPLERSAAFHEMRGMSLMAGRDFGGALAAFTDALAVDPSSPAALLAQGRLALGRGDVETAVRNSTIIARLYPRAEHSWDFRVEIAERIGRPDLATPALIESTQRWPSNPVSWFKLGLLFRQQGDEDAAAQALEKVRVLRPSLLEREEVRSPSGPEDEPR